MALLAVGRLVGRLHGTLARRQLRYSIALTRVRSGDDATIFALTRGLMVIKT